MLPVNHPVEPIEVVRGLEDIAAAAGMDGSIPAASIPKYLSDSDVYHGEDSGSSSASSCADDLMRIADRPVSFTVVDPVNEADAQDGEEAISSVMGKRREVNDLANIVANMVNDPVLGPQICSFLDREATFRRLVDYYSPHRQLECHRDSQVLRIEDQRARAEPRNSDDNPISFTIKLILNLAESIGHAVCAFGGQLRRIPEDLKLLL